MAGSRSVILDHPDRARIEYDLARGVPVRVVARKYKISKDSAYRYLRKMRTVSLLYGRPISPEANGDKNG